jgi:hypothetical protein
MASTVWRGHLTSVWYRRNRLFRAAPGTNQLHQPVGAISQASLRTLVVGARSVLTSQTGKNRRFRTAMWRQHLSHWSPENTDWLLSSVSDGVYSRPKVRRRSCA